MSSNHILVKKIEALAKEIAAMPPVKGAKTVRPLQPSRVERPVRALAPGWGNFAATIKANDQASLEDRQAKAAAFAASGEEQYTITEVYKEGKF